MKKFFIVLFAFLTLNFSPFSQKNDDKVKFAVTIDNTEIVIPVPRFGLIEVGSENHHLFAQVVPNTNRLLAAYYKPEELTDKIAGKKGWTSSYALIETVIDVENIDISPAQFSQLNEESKKLIATRWDTIITLTQEVIRSRFGDINERQFDLGKFEHLAVVQDTTDIFSYLLRMDIKSNDEVMRYVATATYIRAKSKLLLIYLYRRYENPETILALVKDSQEWNRNILVANPTGGLGSILRFLSNLNSKIYLALIGILLFGIYKLYKQRNDRKEIESIEKRIKDSES